MTNQEIAEQIRQLAAQNMSVTVIAERLGVSRQWIYMLCKAHDIEILRHGRSVPETLTGGIRVPLSSRIGGAVAELLAAADLMARGYQVFTPILNSKGHDIIAIKNEKIFTVEVRTGWRLADGSLRLPTKAASKSQIHAFVVAGEPVIYKPEVV